MPLDRIIFISALSEAISLPPYITEYPFHSDSVTQQLEYGQVIIALSCLHNFLA